MAGGGGGGDAQQPSRGGRRGHCQKAAWLPLDIIISEIAARSDPATLVRCAATCTDARRRVASDPGLLGRLRLRETERFVLPLLRGHLMGLSGFTSDFEETTEVYMVDTTAADATRIFEATFADADETLRNVLSMDSRGGLVLVRATTTTTTTQNNTHQRRQLLVWNPATRRRLVLPPEPAFPLVARLSTDVQFVLLVGDSNGEGGASVGWPFQVVMAKLVLSKHHRSHRRLLVHTFSSEHGAWSPLTEIPTPNLDGSDSWPSPPLQRRPLVVGDVVHWLCLTDVGSYVLMLHVRAARVNVTALPASFPRDGKNNHPYDDERHHYLLATATAGGNPVVLVSDADRISAWEQSKHTKMWKQQPHVVIENEAILRFNDETTELVKKKKKIWTGTKHDPKLKLVWFGERSGAVLLRIHGRCLLWLDLQSNKIVRCFSSGIRWSQVYCPYEMNLSSWVPTFSGAVTL